MDYYERKSVNSRALHYISTKCPTQNHWKPRKFCKNWNPASCELSFKSIWLPELNAPKTDTLAHQFLQNNSPIDIFDVNGLIKFCHVSEFTNHTTAWLLDLGDKIYHLSIWMVVSIWPGCIQCNRYDFWCQNDHHFIAFLLYILRLAILIVFEMGHN